MYTRTFPLDVACRVWDLFCRDGDCFLFRTAIGELSFHVFYHKEFVKFVFEHVTSFICCHSFFFFLFPQVSCDCSRLR